MLAMGEWEVFLDDCKLFAKCLEGEATPKTRIDVVVGEQEVHATCLQKTFLGLEDGDSWNDIMDWMSY